MSFGFGRPSIVAASSSTETETEKKEKKKEKKPFHSMHSMH